MRVRLVKMIRRCYWIVQNEISELSYIIQLAYERGLVIVLNPSPMNEMIRQLPLAYVDYLILNEVEGQMLCGQENMPEDGEQMLKLLMRKLPDAKIVLTLGEKGTMYGFQHEIYKQSIYEVTAVDTTATGDTYTGFFVGSLMQGKTIPEALKIAACASAIAVTRKGAVASIPYMDEVMDGI